MIHQPLGGFQGQAADMEIHAKEMLETRDRLNKILAKHTGQSVEKIKTDTDRDNFMDGADAIAYGLIDRVLEKRGDLRARAVAGTGCCKRARDSKVVTWQQIREITRPCGDAVLCVGGRRHAI